MPTRIVLAYALIAVTAVVLTVWLWWLRRTAIRRRRRRSYANYYRRH